MEKIVTRKEFVGKRIITSNQVDLNWDSNCENHKIGIIRCSSSLDTNDTDFKLCVEWLNLHWEEREWIELQDFAQVYIEDRIVLTSINQNSLPVLVFTSIKGDKTKHDNSLFAEFFHDHRRTLLDENNISEVSMRSELEELPVLKQDPTLKNKLFKWINLQGCQQLLTQPDSILVGTWILVYWHSSSLQWKNAMITSQDKDGLMVMTEQVLTETFVDPTITQVKFVDKNFLGDFLSQKVTRPARRKGRNSFPTACLKNLSRRNSIGKRKSSQSSVNSNDYESEQNFKNLESLEKQNKTSVKHLTVKRKRSKTLPKSKKLIKQRSDISNCENEPTKCLNLNTEQSSDINHYDKVDIKGQSISLSNSNEQENSNHLDNSSKAPNNTLQSPSKTDNFSLNNAIENDPNNIVNMYAAHHCDKLNILARVATDKINSDLKSKTQELIAQKEKTTLPRSSSPKNHCSDTICNSTDHRNQTTLPDCVKLNSTENQEKVTSVTTSSISSVLQDNSVKSEKELDTNTVSESTLPNFVGGTSESSFSAYKKTQEVNSSANPNHEMQNSQHARTLHAMAARQQALLQQQQQQQQHLAQVTGQSPHLLAYPPYPFQLFYGNPAAASDMTSLMLANAQSQLTQADLASNPFFAQQLLTQSQNALLAKSFGKDYLLQQQALCTALLRPNAMMEGGFYPGHPLYRPTVSPGGNSRTATPKSLADHQQALLSAQDQYRPDKHHHPSDSPQQQRSPPFHPRTTPTQQQQRSPSSHKGSPAPPRHSPLQTGATPTIQYVKEHLEERKRKLEEKNTQEENWRMMEKRRFRIADVEKNLDPSRQNHFHHNNITQPANKDPPRSSVTTQQHQVYMMDPATYVATHPVKYISSDGVKPQASSLKDSVAINDLNSKVASVSQSIASSSRVWQTSAPGGSVTPRNNSPKRVNKNPPPTTSQNWGNFHYPQITSMQPPQTQQSNVINIHSLKYSPSMGNHKTPPVSPKIKQDRGVIVKTTSSPGSNPGRDQPNNVKYIKENLPQHKPDQEESLGPLMPDGSRARILTPDSLMHLHQFPSPMSKPISKQPKSSEKPNNSVIINGGHYKVTALHNSANKQVTSYSMDTNKPPNHVVYVKPNPEPLQATDLSIKRPQHSNNNLTPPKKIANNDEVRIQSLSRPTEVKYNPKEDNKGRNNVIQATNGNIKNFSTENDLKNMPQHMLPLIKTLTQSFNSPNSSLVWNDPYSIGNAYPGAPSENAIKDALLGVTTKNSTQATVNSVTSVIKSVNSSSNSVTNLSAMVIPEKPKEKVEVSKPSVIENIDVIPMPVISNSKLTNINSNALPKSVQPSSDSDVSSNSDFFTSSTTIMTSKVKPQETVVTKMPCAKMKKAWLQRLPEENADEKPAPIFPKPLKRKSVDETIESVVNDSLSENISSLASVNEKSTSENDVSPPLKKQKKKHKTKDKDKDKDKKPKDPNKKKKNKVKNKVLSNSKKYLLGILPFNNNALNESCEIEDNKKKKAKPKVEMPLGENGLPVSVLLCGKEQARLKKTGESFLQDAACYDLFGIQGITLYVNDLGVSTLPKCRECRHSKSKENSAIFCRFYGFRKLSFINGQLQSPGFCDPEDSVESDLSLWLPRFTNAVKSNDKSLENKKDGHLIETQACMYVMRHICLLFFEIVQKEKEYMRESKDKFAWKRPIAGVREMCDVCETTLFNMHWVCQVCGLSVCCDCHKARSMLSTEDAELNDSERNNSLKWLRCTKGKFHKAQELMPTQIIPSTCIFDLCEMVHQVKEKWVKRIYNSASLTHKNSDPTPLLKNHCNNELLSKSTKPEVRHTNSAPSRDKMKGYDYESSASPLDWLASIALRDQKKNKVNGIDDKTLNGKNSTEKSTASNRVYTDWSDTHAPLSTLCNELLQLTDSTSKVNIDSFQQQWVFARPVIVSGSHKCLTPELWKPEKINEEHGDEPTGNALVNCRLGSVITNACISDFWNGFECIANRLCDETTGEKLILKLKDWPTTEDFIDTMPERFDDLMKALPISQYTARDGKFNITAYLPDFFARPDLGPKMYIAYGWVSENDWCNGTTNLHLDISDACNLMVYVGIPQDEPIDAQKRLVEIIREGDVDDSQVERVKTHKPGALWHIFKPCDTDKIRQLIIKVKKEKCHELFEDHDPIHDQQIYLDRKLRKRLLDEYGVKGYPIVQCEGDSVFIPAGAPHQVFNLHSCIKVAEDFVSPEHVNQCSKLMEEFRHLSKNHSNSEDKLQLKNILYHCMKEVVSSLNYHEADGAMEVGNSNPR